MERTIAALMLSALLAAGAQAGPGEEPPAPGAPDSVNPGAAVVVSQLQDGLIGLMQSTDASDARVDALERLLADTHDFPYIARVVLGRHWRALGPEGQAAFVERFRDLSVASYAARFRAYNGERFSTPEDHPASSAAESAETSVESTLTAADGSTHTFEYLLRLDAGRWRIVNIVVDGVSDLALKRGEYGRLMDEGGFSALMADLDRQIQRLREQAAPAT
jgi:phospholipid transport system substrate-binding protein